MEALAVRLSGLDSHVDDAIRIVACYDTLMRRRVDLPTLAQNSADPAAAPTLVELVEAAEPPRPGAGGTYPAAGSASLNHPTSADGAR